MRVLLTAFCICAIVGVATAEKPVILGTQVDRLPCDMTSVAYDWDFAVDDGGFTTTTCDPTGGLAVWGYGIDPVATTSVWGTVIGGLYPSDSGDGLVSPPFDVGPGSNMMEVSHYVDIETNYDGCNVSVDGTVIAPMGGYDGVISTSTSFYAFCVDMEEGYTGHANVWATSCWDLSAYDGQTIQVEFDFGSDSSVTYPGWYLGYVKVGGMTATPTEQTTWGTIKSLY